VRINIILAKLLAEIDLSPFIEGKDTLQPKLLQPSSDGDGMSSDNDNDKDDDEESDIDDDDEMTKMGTDVEALGNVLKAGKC
jgi:hypothetical protein